MDSPILEQKTSNSLTNNQRVTSTTKIPTWHNFLVNLSPNPLQRNEQPGELSTLGWSSGFRKSPFRDSENKISHFDALSGDLFDLRCDNRRRKSIDSDDDDDCNGGGGGGGGEDECEWYQFDDNYCIEPFHVLPSMKASNEHDDGDGGERSWKNDRFVVHSLTAARLPPNGRIRKSWGNFINIFDEQGIQKICVAHSELSNYLLLRDPDDHYGDDVSSSSSSSAYRFYLTLFTGNYPKSLFRSTWSWRMRWNVFVEGLSGDALGPLETIDRNKSNNRTSPECGPLASDKRSSPPSGADDNQDCSTKTSSKKKSGEERCCNDTGLKLVHFGEMHIYFHIERGHQEPVYQNLCFFFDPALVKFCERSASMDDDDHDDAHNGDECAKAALEDAALRLKYLLSLPRFTTQLYFPIEKMRFDLRDQSVDYFVLRQKDLQAAIAIANQEVPFAFLHPSSTTTTANDDHESNRQSSRWSVFSSSISSSSSSSISAEPVHNVAAGYRSNNRSSNRLSTGGRRTGDDRTARNASNSTAAASWRRRHDWNEI